MPSTQDDEWSYKMCKKIAQLTKVIYTLNCKNEDNEERTQWLQQQHAAEMSRLREQHSERLQEAARQLQELQSAQTNSLSGVQSMHTQLLKEAQSGFDLKLAKLVTETEKCKSAYEAAVASTREEYERRIADEVATVKKTKDDETTNLVREYNERYKAMLAQQLDEKDSLEKALVEQWSGKVAALEAQLANSQNQSAKTLADTTLSLRDAEAQVKTLTNENNRLKDQVNELTTSSAELKRQHDDLAARLSAEQHNLAAKSNDESTMRTRLEGLQLELDQTTASLATIQAELRESQLRCERLQSECVALTNEKEAFSTRVTSLEGDLDAVRAQTATLTTERDRLQATLTELENTHKGSEANQQQYLNTIHELEQRVANLERMAEEQSAAQQAKLLLLEQEHAEALRRTGAEVEQFGAARVGELERQLSEMEARHASQVRDMESSYAAQHAQLELQHEAATKALQEEVSSLEGKLSAAAAALAASQEECATLTNDLDAQRTVATEVDELRRRHGALEATCQAHVLRIQDLEASLAELTSRQADSEESKQARIEALERELVSSRDTLVQKHAAEMEEQRVAFEARLAASEKSHQSLVESMKAEHVLGMKQLRDNCTRDVAASVRSSKEALEELEATHRKAMTAAATQAQETKEALQNRIAALEDLLHQAHESSSAKSQERAQEAAQLRANIENLENTQRQKDADAAAALHRLREELSREAQTALDTARAQFEAALEKQRQKNKDAADAHAAALAKLTAESDEHMRQKDERHKLAMKEYGEQLTKDKKELIDSIVSAHEKQMETQRNEADATVRALQDQVRASQAAVAEWERKHAVLLQDSQQAHAAIEREKSAHAAYRSESEQQRTALQQRHDEAVQQLEDRHAAQLQRVAQDHRGIVDDMMAQHRSEAQSLQSALDQLRSELEELKHKYLYRESRPEDVDLINQLLKDNKAKEKALAKAYEDMKMYKLELINREESYNKVFGRRPVVAEPNDSQVGASRTHLPAIRSSGTDAAAASRATSQTYH